MLVHRQTGTCRLGASWFLSAFSMLHTGVAPDHTVTQSNKGPMLHRLPCLHSVLSSSAKSGIKRLRHQHCLVAASATQGHQQISTEALADKLKQDQRTQQAQLQQQWFQQSDVYYSNYPLNRASDQRRDEEQLHKWFNEPKARVTPVMGSKILLTTSSNSKSDNGNGNTSNSSSSGTVKYHPVWVSPAAELGAALSPTVPPLFLGLDSQGAPHFAVQVTRESGSQLADIHAASWLAARAAGPDMSRTDAALMAVASGLAQWNLDTQYHGASGAQTLPKVRTTGVSLRMQRALQGCFLTVQFRAGVCWYATAPVCILRLLMRQC